MVLFPKQVPQLVNKHSNIWAYGGEAFSFKPLQRGISRMHSVYELNQIFPNKTSHVQFIYLLQIGIRKNMSC